MSKKSGFEINQREFNQMIRTIESLGKNSEKIKEEILRKAAKPLETELKLKARYLDDAVWAKDNEKYGTIEDNIKMKWNPKEEKLYLHTAKAYWASMIEWGNGGREGKSKKQTFFYNTVDSKRNEVLTRALKLLKRRFKL